MPGMMSRQVITWNTPTGTPPVPRPASQDYVPGRVWIQRPDLDQQEVGVKSPIDTDYSTGQSAPINDVLVGTNATMRPWDTDEHMNFVPGNWLAICRSISEDARWPAMNVRDFNITMREVYNQVMAMLSNPKERDLKLKTVIQDWLDRGEIALTGNPDVLTNVSQKTNWGKLRALTVTSIMEDWNFKGVYQNRKMEEQAKGRETRIALQGPTTFQKSDQLWSGLTEGSSFGFWLRRVDETLANGATRPGPFQLVPWESNSPWPRDPRSYYYYDTAGVQHSSGYVYCGTVYQRPFNYPAPGYLASALGKVGTTQDALAIVPPQFAAVLDAPPWLRRFVYTN